MVVLTRLLLYFLWLSMLKPLRTDSIKNCGMSVKAVKDSVLILSDELVDANAAEEKCLLLDGHLVISDDFQINKTLTQLLTHKYTAGLKRIWIFYNTGNPNYYKYSLDSFESEIWKSTKDLGQLWFFDSLTQEPRSNMLFCHARHNRWRVTFGGNCSTETNGWTFDFSTFTRINKQVGHTTVYVYNGGGSSIFQTVNEPHNRFTNFYRAISVPDIYVFIGARYNTSSHKWVWNNGSPANFSSSNFTSCQQRTLHYRIGWEQSRKRCSGEQAYYACQVKFAPYVKTFICNSSTVNVTWTGLDEFIDHFNFKVQVHVQVLDLNFSTHAAYKNNFVMVENLNYTKNYTIQVTAYLTGCINSSVTSELNVTTLPPPPQSCFPHVTTKQENSNNYPTTTTTSNNNNKTSTALIIGIMFAAIIVLSIGGWLFWMKRRSKNNKEINIGTPNLQLEHHCTQNDVDDTYENIAIRFCATTLFDFYKKSAEVNFTNLIEEFKKIVQDSKNNVNPKEVSQLPENASRNRYKNIYPYDHARVVLHQSGGKDYINAAYIPGYNNEKKFIATQGPKKETLNEFWLMVWQENTKIVVMLTGLSENGKAKCEQYWPNLGSESMLTFDVVSVKCIQETSFGGLIRRDFVISKEQKERIITQLQYTTWPDHGVPVTTSNMMYLRNVVNDLHNTGSPIIVHCSAGCGRTGTYIAMDSLFDELDDRGTVNVPQTVLGMRQNRTDMIQTSKQYIFLYKLLMEHEHLMETNKNVTELEEMTSAELDEMVENEFATLSTFRFGEDWQPSDNKLHTYKDTAIGVWNAKTESVEYLNASCVQVWLHFLQRDQDQTTSEYFVAAQGPDIGKEEEFWKMTVMRNLFVIVDLSKTIKIANNKLYQHGEVTISVKELDQTPVYNIFTFEISSGHMTVGQMFTLLQINEWNDVENPPNELDFVNVIETMHRLKTERNCHSVLICCSNGSTRTGTFIALVNILERLKTQRQVDVFRTVKDLRDMKPNMLDNKVLYKLCYSLVMKYLIEFRADPNSI